jgi:trans-2-enoyl-CoA reductase
MVGLALLSCTFKSFQALKSLSNLPIAPLFLRSFSSTSSPLVARVAEYSSTGEIDKAIELKSQILPELGQNDVLIKFLAAPINPADINMVEGVYHIRPELPAIGGNEGVAQVLAIGSAVTQHKAGDWVIPAQPGFGTWRSHAVCSESAVDYIDSDISIESAATVSVNPATAYRMLHDFIQLKPGDCLIQNGANSAVGSSIIQLAKHMHIKTINIIRDRPNLQLTVDRLTQLGADLVVTEETAGSRHMKELISKFPQPVLGLNCVGGSSSAEISRLLADNSPLVTYGGMSRKPVQIPTGRLIFNNIKIQGFWLSNWTKNHNSEERQSMIHTLTRLIKQGKLQSSAAELIGFQDFQKALARAREPYRDRKIVLKFD